MKIMVTGANGQLGRDVVSELKQRRITCLGVDIDDFDITNGKEADVAIAAYSPDVVVHCAAYTDVDSAEDEPEICQKINAEATEMIAKACAKINAAMLYISTDYVFDGSGTTPFETNSPTNPINTYGHTKLAGEFAVKANLSSYFIVRTSWVFGKNGKNFVKTMQRLGSSRNQVNVVCDQVGSPTYTEDLAELIADMAVTNKYGTYHASNEGYCSWAEFAEAIFALADYETKVNFITTEEYHTRAVRPHNSRLSRRCLDENGFARLPHWKDALSRFFIKTNSI